MEKNSNISWARSGGPLPSALSLSISLSFYFADSRIISWKAFINELIITWMLGLRVVEKINVSMSRFVWQPWVTNLALFILNTHTHRAENVNLHFYSLKTWGRATNTFLSIFHVVRASCTWTIPIYLCYILFGVSKINVYFSFDAFARRSLVIILRTSNESTIPLQRFYTTRMRACVCVCQQNAQ